MSLCHTVMADVKLNNQIIYTASSPDEQCLVNAAKYFGVTFAAHTDDDKLIVEKNNELHSVSLKYIFPFDSNRRRMSIVYEDAEKNLVMITKGSDDVIMERLSEEDNTEFYIKKRRN